MRREAAGARHLAGGLAVRRVAGGSPSRKAGRDSMELSRMTTVAASRGASLRHCSDAADMCSSSQASTCLQSQHETEGGERTPPDQGNAPRLCKTSQAVDRTELVGGPSGWVACTSRR